MTQNWLRLLHAEGIGPSRFQRLLDAFGSPAEVLRASDAQLRSSGLTQELIGQLHAVDDATIETDLVWAEHPQHHILSLDNPAYPKQLLSIETPPPLLFVMGDPDVLSHPGISIVGSRNPTPSGREIAFDFARELAGYGLCITSGLAMGIDTAAHKGALKADGITIAVAATGLDRVYPSSNRELAHQIVEQGALISEFPIGTEVRAGHFPRRNRIISGLSVGTLVVEAALRSGSLITARLAMEQGRDVFAIPGSINNPLARGCHQLLREGARLVESAADILEELAGRISLSLTPHPPEKAPQTEPDELSPDHVYLLEKMGFDPISIDQLVRHCGLTAEEVSSMLLIMELEGRVAALPGGFYQRLKPRE
jgi:DNA processing protein